MTIEAKQIIEGNKLIADFMGYQIEGDWVLLGDDYNGRYHISILEFHKSWGKLMPVVEKIEALGYDTNIFKDEDGNQVMIWKAGFSYKREKKDLVIENDPCGNTEKIQAVWKSVIQFIQWYNTINTNIKTNQ